MNRIRVGVFLKGGIGNQLFQIAAAFHLSQGSRIALYGNFTLPRKSKGVPDLLLFALPSSVEHAAISGHLVDRKLLSISLRQAITLQKNKFIKISKLLTAAIVNLYFSFRFRKRATVVSGEGVGYSPLKLKPGFNLLNGYFQSYLYVNDFFVQNQMRSLQIKSKSAKLTELICQARQDDPVFIHLRLGDYRSEASIGILTTNYYKRALELLSQTRGSKKIWVFSDEPKSVRDFINPPYNFELTIVDDADLNPAEVLELMRYGSAYVIANSTFSWWGAYLAYKEDCIRIMPTPWFQGAPSPEGIRPKNWIEIEYLE